MVQLANTASYPEAVVVEFGDAGLAGVAVSRAIRLQVAAVLAVVPGWHLRLLQSVLGVYAVGRYVMDLGNLFEVLGFRCRRKFYRRSLICI